MNSGQKGLEPQQKKTPPSPAHSSSDLTSVNGDYSTGLLGGLGFGSTVETPHSVVPDARSDAKVEHEIYDLLSSAHELDHSRITVNASSDEIILQGSVSFQEQKKLAEAITSRVAGNRKVLNQLAVQAESDRRRR